MIITHIVTDSESGMTLQQLLRGPMGLSGRETRNAKAQGGVTVDGAPFFSNQKVKASMTVCVRLESYANAPVNILQAPPISVIYEDDALIAAYKPALLQCHPSPSAPGGSDTLESRVSAYLGAPAHPVHRLDAETTGVVLFARLPYVQAHLQRQMQEGTFQKIYQAWVWGKPEPPCGVIDAPIEREHPDSFTRVVRADGQTAVSRYETIKSIRLTDGTTVSLVALFPLTGRTHQLRVHMAYIGHPLLGDTRYASADSKTVSDTLALGYHQLSAVSLSFIHPITGKMLSLSHPAVFSFSPDQAILSPDK